ncbi:MAG: T9SS C-terminal target domain-containing protein, partial [Phycisphaerales bacterium]
MKHVTLRTSVAAALAAAALAGAAGAAEILVTADIATSTTWTKNNTYNLQAQIYVLPGATLTIEPGTVIASTTNLGGSLAVTRDARIVAVGTADEPIIFTSK